MCTSSSAREKVNSPFSISASTRSRPAAILRASSLEMMPCCAEHGRMRLGCGDVVGCQRLVEADGGVYLLHDLGRRHGEAASPHLVGGFVGHQINLSVQRRERACRTQPPARTARRRAAVTLGAAALAAAVGFAAVYVTLGRPDNAVPQEPRRHPRPRSQACAGAPLGPGQQSPEPGADGGLRLPQGAGGAARGHLPGCRGQGAHLGRLARQGGAGQPVGHLVPALPQGDALARPPAEGAGVGQVRGGCRQRRPQGSGGVEEVSRRDPGAKPRPLCRCDARA